MKKEEEKQLCTMTDAILGLFKEFHALEATVGLAKEKVVFV